MKGKVWGYLLEIVERALLGELLWLSGHSWQSLWGNLLRIGSLGKQTWLCRWLKLGYYDQGAPVGAQWETSHG